MGKNLSFIYNTINFFLFVLLNLFILTRTLKYAAYENSYSSKFFKKISFDMHAYVKKTSREKIKTD